MLVQAFRPEKRKEDLEPQNVNLIKSIKYRHTANISCVAEGKVVETTTSGCYLD